VYSDNLQERASKATVDTSWGGTKNIHPSRLSNIPANQRKTEVSAIPQDIEEDFRSIPASRQVQPDEISQVWYTICDISHPEVGNLESDCATQSIDKTGKFINDSRRDTKALKKKPDPSSHTRSGKVPVKPWWKRQRNFLQSIPKDMIAEYLSARK